MVTLLAVASLRLTDPHQESTAGGNTGVPVVSPSGSSATSSPTTSPATPATSSPSSPTASLSPAPFTPSTTVLVPPQTTLSPAVGSTTPTAAAGPLTCWNGQAVADLEDCPDLTGRTGLEWVFADYSEVASGCTPSPHYDHQLTAYRCRLRLADGGLVRATYSEYPTPQALDTHYTATYGGTSQETTERWIYGPIVLGSGGYEASAVVADGRRWAVTVASPDETEVATAIEQVRIRTTEEFDAHVGPPPAAE